MRFTFCMPTSVEDEIRSKTQAFAKDLAVLVRQAALEAAAAALGGGAPMATGTVPVQVGAKRGRGRPRKAAAPAPAPTARPVSKAAQVAPASKPAPAARAAVSRKAPPKRAPGEKRPPGELAKLTDKLGDFIKSHPGQRMEAIGKALGTPTKELNLPIKKLLAAKKIRSEGQKRATEYFRV